jgi:hypothetical protein
MRLYKILKKEGDEYLSPFQGFYYGKMSDFINQDMVCKDFDKSTSECSSGFYATDLYGLIYTNLSGNKVVFEVEMSGKNRKFDTYKWRWEMQKFIREIPIDELKNMVKKQSEKMDWDYYHALFPVNPFSIKTKLEDKHISLLREWASVWASVGASVRASVWDSVRDSVGASVLDSVRDSVWDSVRASVWDSVRASVWTSVRASVWTSVGDSVLASVRAYISSFFPNIDWKYIKHKTGVNPFQPCIDLWNAGFVPSFDGRKWRLHSGENAEIVYEIEI